MLGRTIKRQKPLKKIEARTLAKLAEGVDLLSRLRVGYGLVQEMVAGIMTIRVSQSLSFAKCCQVGSSGITAFVPSTKALGKGTVRIFDVDPVNEKLVDTGVDITVYNDIPASVAGSRWGQFKIIDGVPFIDVASCS